MLTSEKKILAKWADHWTTAASLSKRVTRFTPTLDEVQIGTRQLSISRAPAADSIPAEIYEKGGSTLTGKHPTLI